MDCSKIRRATILVMILLLLLPLTTFATSASTSRSVTGNEDIEIEMEGYASLTNVRAFETGELINWNLTWQGIDNTSVNLYHYDYTVHAGYANNGTLTYNGSGIGFTTQNGSLTFSIPAFELWVNSSYEYTLRIVLWDQSRNQLLDFAEEYFVIFQSSITSNASKLLVFGDSLSDMGNSKATYGTPESPPYYSGRFATGPMWNEHLAVGMGIGITPGAGSGTGSNRAFGGAEAGEGLNFFVIPNIGKQIEDYTNNYWIAPNEKVAIWGGGNNFLNSGETDTQKVVNYIVNHVNDLASNGAKDILVLNMPPLEKTPTYSGESDSNKQAMHARMIDFNEKLDTAMTARRGALNISIQLIDIFEMFETIYWNSSFYGLSNVTHAACHHQGYLCESGDYIEPTVDEFIFFDKIHPTGTTHKLLGMYILEQIGTPDTDGDGIENNADNCPNTPIGDYVNHFGCRLVDLDSDQDGVNDLLDQCHGTSVGATVDEDGCADYQKDTDQDGVTDNIDICSETLANHEVDSDGCADYQKDTDQDGVTDDIDVCPDTDAGAEINLIGCAQNQIDSDWDGVMNDADQCPNTPHDEEVDDDGCSLSQLDSDEDGVTDDLDLCPNTPAQSPVDDYGCALTQLDSDYDGVSDAIDICDLTPRDETANEVGCSPTQRDSDGDGRNDAIDECPNSSGSIRGCPIMDLTVQVLHWPEHHNDNAVLLANASCENDCTFTTIFDNNTLFNQSPGEYELNISSHSGQYELVLRIERDISWMERKVYLVWPSAPDIRDNSSTVSDSQTQDDSSSEALDAESWQISSSVEYLMAILIFIGIGLTIGSIIRMNRAPRQPRLNWDEKLSSFSTFEVERDLRDVPQIGPDFPSGKQNNIENEDTKSDINKIPSIDEILD